LASCGLLVLATPQPTATSQSIDTSPIALPALELLSGNYRYVGNAEQDHAKIQKSIEAAVTSLG